MVGCTGQRLIAVARRSWFSASVHVADCGRRGALITYGPSDLMVRRDETGPALSLAVLTLAADAELVFVPADGAVPVRGDEPCRGNAGFLLLGHGTNGFYPVRCRGPARLEPTAPGMSVRRRPLLSGQVLGRCHG